MRLTIKLLSEVAIDIASSVQTFPTYLYIATVHCHFEFGLIRIITLGHSHSKSILIETITSL